MSRKPWLLRPGTWERVTSYAWHIYLCATKYGRGAEVPAHEWACAFKCAFTRPYVNVVLPLFNKQDEPKLADQVVGDLSVVLLTIERILEEHGHHTAATIQELVSLDNPV